MTVEYTYDEETNFIYTRFSGVLTDDDLEIQARAVAGDPRIKRGARELVDLRAVEKIEASIESIGIIICLDIENRDKFEGMKTAIVAPGDLLFGLSKIFEVRSEVQGSPSTINVFRTMDEAKGWLGIDR